METPVQDEDVPCRFGLYYREVVFAAPFRADYGVPVPLVIADQPDARQRHARRVDDTPRDVGGCPGAAGAAG